MLNPVIQVKPIVTIMDTSVLTFLFFFVIVTNATAYRCNVTHNSTTIDCTSLGLKNLPEHLKDHLVTVMIFNHNQLDSNTTFYNWTDLRYLDVSYNSMTNITSQTFKELINLKVLNISYNNVQDISEDAFDNLKTLEVIDLSGNPHLVGFNYSHGFNYALLLNLLNSTLNRSLKKLVIRSSQLNVLPETLFEYAHELQYLDLTDNYLTRIPKLPSNLIHLDLSHNYISNIGTVPFFKKHSLRNMFLEYNDHLYNIDIDAFETATNLSNVSFKGCKSLSRLHPNLFYFNKNLTHLSLANCSLKTLPRQYELTFVKLLSLELEDNPWICDSSIEWFLTLNSSFIKNVRCQEPTNSTILDYYGTRRHGAILHQLLLVLGVLVLILLGLVLSMAYMKERKRRLQNPYVPLQDTTSRNRFNPLYMTTVV